MGALFSYSIVSSLLLCCGYVVYKWLFSAERQHGYNRVLIYSIYLLSLIIPLLLGVLRPVDYATQTGNGGVEIGIPVMQGALDHASLLKGKLHLFQILLGTYLAGILGMIVYSFFGMMQLYGIIKSGERVVKEDYILVLLEKTKIAPLSWRRYVVMNREDYENAGDLIIVHELRHLNYHHWIDLMFAQLVLIFQWFNPAAWLFREEFKTVHEYQADEAVIESGANIKEYQMLLIKKAVGTRFHSLANSLNHSKLKKRVTMMYKEKSSLRSRLSALLLVPAMALGCFAVQIPAFAGFLNAESETTLFSRTESKVSKKTPIKSNSERIKSVDERNNITASKEISPAKNPSIVEESVSSQEFAMNQAPIPKVEEGEGGNRREEESGEKIYSAVQETAQPEGGMKALIDFLHRNIEYPEEAVKEGKEGRVVVRFVVEKNGDVGAAEIIKGVDGALDKEALRVVKMMPKWTPAKVDGEPVTSYYVIPVAFTLPKDEEKAE